MTDLLKIGLSALLTQQRALAATSNNIANANTPGYSRQRVEFGERPAERLGSGFVGTGVDATLVRRITDDIVAQQMFFAASSFNRADVFANLAASIDNLLAADQTGLNITLQNFVNAGQDLAADPGSVPARQVMLSEARNLASRFQMFDRRLGEVGREVSTRLQATVTEINGLGAGIADINQRLLASGVAPGGQLPPDLLDQRDRLLGRLAELVKVDAVSQSDGTLSVFIGSGQALVLGTNSSTLAAVPGGFNPGQTDIVLQGGGASLNITQFLSGGEVGGLLDFRREMLDPARANLGRLAVGLVDTFNAMHREGMDLSGQLGGDFFSIDASQVYPASVNTGGATVTAGVADVAALQSTGYRLSFDGASFQLFRADDGTPVGLSGSGTVADPFLADGLSIVVSGGPAAGDRFLLDPLGDAAGSLQLLIGDPDSIAAAAPIATRVGLANLGDATISPGEVADVTDPALLATTTIEFLDPSTYSINGAGAFAYTNGGDIVVNGSRVQISGSPAAGDQFVIESNAGGAGDNRNALRLSGVLSQGVLDGGATDLTASVGQLIAQVGSQTAEVFNQRDAQGLLLQQAEQALESVRGVNLDEEAANLLRQEQAYQAAAQTITVADTLFQSLLLALRG
jgi:flagellar hook-associated protein 1 FlgK